MKIILLFLLMLTSYPASGNGCDWLIPKNEPAVCNNGALNGECCKCFPDNTQCEGCQPMRCPTNSPTESMMDTCIEQSECIHMTEVYHYDMEEISWDLSLCLHWQRDGDCSKETDANSLEYVEACNFGLEKMEPFYEYDMFCYTGVGSGDDVIFNVKDGDCIGATYDDRIDNLMTQCQPRQGIDSGCAESTTDEPSRTTRDRIADDFDPNCNTDNGIVDCYALNATVNYQTATVQFEELQRNPSECCYTYKVVHESARTTCNGNNPFLSHLTMDYVCERSGFTVTGGSRSPQIGLDGSTCYEGIKWIQGIRKADSEYHFEVCLTWDDFDSSQCSEETSWYMVKAGNTFDFEEMDQVPGCNAIDTTNPPTVDPTIAPNEFNSGAIPCKWTVSAPIYYQYILVREEKSWHNAQRHCQRVYNSSLATVVEPSSFPQFNYLLERVSPFWFGAWVDELQLVRRRRIAASSVGDCLSHGPAYDSDCDKSTRLWFVCNPENTGDDFLQSGNSDVMSDGHEVERIGVIDKTGEVTIISAAGVLLIGVVAICVYCYCKKKQRDYYVSNEHQTHTRVQSASCAPEQDLEAVYQEREMADINVVVDDNPKIG